MVCYMLLSEEVRQEARDRPHPAISSIDSENLNAWVSSTLVKVLYDPKDIGCIFPEKTPLVLAHL